MTETMQRMKLLAAFQACGGAYGEMPQRAAQKVIETMVGPVEAGIELPATWTLERYLQWHADDFATEHLSVRARALAQQINGAIELIEKRPASGVGCRAYYDMGQWAKRRESHHLAELVVVHERGDLSLRGPADVRRKVQEVLGLSGYELIEVSPRYSVVAIGAPRGDGEGRELIAELVGPQVENLLVDLLGDCACWAPGRCDHASERAARLAGEWIRHVDAFEADCAHGSTDMGRAWELLKMAREALELARGVML